ncbi:hypothetical protein Mp_7g12250 [Marchantia polymorpha subsp. ruderalis]|uniref:Uncharacterized protein n=2 Tax=Marchantia polymorpha TaxID=3197 RepID=A0AAF6BYP8_MARPO|nr:hypothetical protein MARPO_0003s0238 [Marchantia polymorpha]BBN17132.1 hypothetical protein Mp_7g12250 [Marchantia polymorpha subsp. ruderalis]|eukprot:PTQ49371.1 hypothetical protein MARPO_0003s0238 [Marchantia polymorpha]
MKTDEKEANESNMKREIYRSHRVDTRETVRQSDHMHPNILLSTRQCCKDATGRPSVCPFGGPRDGAHRTGMFLPGTKLTAYRSRGVDGVVSELRRDRRLRFKDRRRVWGRMRSALKNGNRVNPSIGTRLDYITSHSNDAVIIARPG